MKLCRAALATRALTCALSSRHTRKNRAVDITFVGDVMVAEEPGELIERGVDPFAPGREVLSAREAPAHRQPRMRGRNHRHRARSSRSRFAPHPRVIPDAAEILRRRERGEQPLRRLRQAGASPNNSICSTPRTALLRRRPRSRRARTGRGSSNATACASRCWATSSSSRDRSRPAQRAPASPGAARTNRCCATSATRAKVSRRPGDSVHALGLGRRRHIRANGSGCSRAA